MRLRRKPSGEKKESEIVKALKDTVYGAAMHGMVTYALRARMHLEHLFMLITMGDMLGVPSSRPTTRSGFSPMQSPI